MAPMKSTLFKAIVKLYIILIKTFAFLATVTSEIIELLKKIKKTIVLKIALTDLAPYSSQLCNNNNEELPSWYKNIKVVTLKKF